MSTAKGQRQFDIVVFGATGFTGRYIAEELARSAGFSQLKWAIAGRSAQKLEKISDQISKIAPGNAPKTAIANVDDPASLANLAASARVLINCVGPFRYYGEPVVKACVEQGCNYVDITGEPEFVERMMYEYHDQAVKKGVYIVPCCGFDSIPADVGASFARDALAKKGAVCSSVESYLSIQAEKGYVAHYTTYECAVLGFGAVKSLRDLRKKVPRVKVPYLGAPPSRRGLHFSKEEQRWSAPFPGSDAAIVRKSQTLFTTLSTKNVQPVHFAAYFCMPSFWAFCLMVVYGGVFQFFARFKFGRSLLLKYPGLFTNGVFSHEGGSEEQLKASVFNMNFFAKGYSTKEKAAAGASTDCVAKVRVSGPDPGYLGTSIITTQCALQLLEQPTAITRGGVLTPSVAFHGTKLVDRLTAAGIKFEVLDFSVGAQGKL